MASTITWHRDAGDELLQGKVQIVSKWFLFCDSKKIIALWKLADGPQRIDEWTIRMHWQDGTSCDCRFESPQCSDRFDSEVEDVWAKRTAKRKRSSVNSLCGNDVNRPSVGSRKRDFSDVAGVATANPSRIKGGAFSTPPAASRQPNDQAARAQREKKRRAFDDRIVTTDRRTPEKTSMVRAMYTGGGYERASGSRPTRAQESRPQALSFAPARPAVQSSSFYGGYRSPETFGLRNLGNTCYLNAVMQALCSLREFVLDLRGMPDAGDGMLYHCTVDILQQMSSRSAAQGPLSPAILREKLAVASPMFGGVQQQDAHEFFLDYLNQLHDELLKARIRWLDAAGNSAEASVQAVEIENSGGLGELATQKHVDSSVQKRLTCTRCNASRDVVERFRDFSLDFNGPVSADCSVLDSMIAEYFADELLEATCDHCNGAGANLEKQLACPPRTLVLHLKRFVPNLALRRYDKRHQSVTLPDRFDLLGVLRNASNAARNRAAAAAEADFAAAKSLQGNGGEVVGSSTVCASSPSATRPVARPLTRTMSAPVSPGPNGASPAPDLSLEPAMLDRAVGSLRGQLPSSTAATAATAPEPFVGVEGSAAEGRSLPLGGELWYDLRAVVAHDGSSPHSGHYVCYACAEDGAWRLYDDSRVIDMPKGWKPQQDLGRKAYILYFVKSTSTFPHILDKFSSLPHIQGTNRPTEGQPTEGQHAARHR